jgi:hypothetical protein
MNSPEIQLTEEFWNSLKVPITIIAALAPMIIVFLVIRYNRIIKRLKKKQETNQKTIEKRIEVYDRIGPKLNDLVSFYSYTGNWKEITPMDIMRLKKELDKDINIYASLFSSDLNQKYSDFMYVCFVSFSGWEHEEKIKSLYKLRQEHNVEWKDDWIEFFDTNNVVDAIMMKERYNKLTEYFIKELNL